MRLVLQGLLHGDLHHQTADQDRLTVHVLHGVADVAEPDPAAVLGEEPVLLVEVATLGGDPHEAADGALPVLGVDVIGPEARLRQPFHRCVADGLGGSLGDEREGHGARVRLPHDAVQVGDEAPDAPQLGAGGCHRGMRHDTTSLPRRRRPRHRPDGLGR